MVAPTESVRTTMRPAVPARAVVRAGLGSPYWCCAVVGILCRLLVLVVLASPLPNGIALPLLTCGLPADLLLGLNTLGVAALRAAGRRE